MTTPVLPPGWAPGDPAYRRITLALFLAGLATFALVYCTQPLLPLLADAFDITPAASTLSLSVTTMAMGVALLVFGPLSDAVGRLALMRITLLIAALIAAEFPGVCRSRDVLFSAGILKKTGLRIGG